MAIALQDLTALMKRTGIAPERVDAMDPARPILAQDFDSVDLPIIAVAAEEAFGVDLADASAADLRTLNDFVAFVNRG
jgi:acyl carrier protein